MRLQFDGGDNIKLPEVVTIWIVVANTVYYQIFLPFLTL